MLYDLNSDPLKNIDYDICIVGSGPAAFASINKITNKRILMLEAGSDEIDALSQEQYEGEITKDNYHDLTTSRLRYLGGTSGHWGGWCKPMDNFDFIKRNYVDHSGWPIKKNDLDKYLDEACNLLEIENDFNFSKFENKIFSETKYQFSDVRYGSKKKKFLINSKNVDCYLNANLYNAIINNSKIENLIIKNYNKKEFKVKAKIFIFAMGGIENSRFLNWIIQKNSIKTNLPIGNYWMEHPNLNMGHIILKKNDYINIKTTQKRYFYSLNQETKIKNKLLNGNICITSKLNENSNLYKKIIYEMKCNFLYPDNVQCINRLNFHGEQQPNFNSKVTLSKKKRDFFDIPNSELHWEKTQFDLLSCQKTILEFKNFIINNNIGSLRLKNWIFDNPSRYFNQARGGNHHMGGTRMSDNKNEGVVDVNCKFHLFQNLFIAGSSVFPTSGEANPTFTITKLSLKLRDHLKKIFRS